MMSNFPLGNVPLDYFADGDRLQVRSKGELIRDSLADFLNRVRQSSQGGPYHVDEDRPGCYDDIPSAIEQGEYDLTEDQAIIVTVDPRSDRDFYLPSGYTLPKRHVFIKATGLLNNFNGSPSPGGAALPRIIGDFNMQSGDGLPRRNVLSLEGVVHEGRIYGKSNTTIYMKDAHFHQGGSSGSIQRTHGAEGCLTILDNVHSNNGQFWVEDADDAPYVTKGALYIWNTSAFLFPSTWLKLRKCFFHFYNSALHLVNFFEPFTLIDLVSTSASVEFYGIDIANFNLGNTSDTALFGNASSASIEWGGCRINDVYTKSLDVGNVVTQGGSPEFSGFVSPLNPPTGSVWKDRTAFAVKMYNGSLWV